MTFFSGVINFYVLKMKLPKCKALLSVSQRVRVQHCFILGNYKGWPNCYRLTNGRVDLIITTDVEPPIIHFCFTGKRNEFVEFEKMLARNGRLEPLINPDSLRKKTQQELYVLSTNVEKSRFQAVFLLSHESSTY